ncbi:DUF4214 domain-containing protein [Alsobacter sp. KACC 23698]|uniref:DUF4214 domain-containing protein n=1 Tax=Alsobacter sp. KACC 23698 TaxID=3149229 RepID=A0AAU7JIU2_9HYPH
MSINGTITFNNAVGETPDILNLLTIDINSALATWSSLLAGNASLKLNVELLNSIPSGRADGAPANVVPISTGAVTVVEGTAAHELRTGLDTVGALPDINIRIQDSFLKNVLFLDPTPDDASDIPSQRGDFVTTIIHEIAHGLGFSGYFGSTVAGSYQSPFDQYISNSGGSQYFTGPNAVSVYGGPVPLTNGNMYHLGNPSPGAGSNLLGDMMNGVSYTAGLRYLPSQLDLAMLADLGIATTRSDRLGLPLSGSHVDGGAGLDTIVFGASSTAYSVKPNSVGFSLGGPNGYTADVVQVERLLFTDQLVALDTAGDAGQGFRLYQAAFNRTPDKSGLSYWVDALDRGASLHDVATGFVASAEFKAVYGASPSSGEIVDRFYHNVLGRAGEQSGTDYWVGLLQKGTSAADILASFSESAENVAKVAPLISSGISLDAGLFA